MLNICRVAYLISSLTLILHFENIPSSFIPQTRMLKAYTPCNKGCSCRFNVGFIWSSDLHGHKIQTYISFNILEQEKLISALELLREIFSKQLQSAY